MANRYSAGLMSQSFWFVETKKVIEMVWRQDSVEKIKETCIQGNLFGVSKEYRARRIYGYIWHRVSQLDAELLDLFRAADIDTQKLILLVAILRMDNLFLEFLYEVYRDKVMLGVNVLTKTDINIFFKNKESQDETVANWKDDTKRHLATIYLNYLTDANLLSFNNGQHSITVPLVDKRLVAYLQDHKEIAILKAITGER